MRRGSAPWPLLVMASVCVLLLTASFVLFARMEWFIHSAVRTTGILDSISSPDGRTGTVFRFSTTDGELIRQVSGVTVRSTGMPAPGDRVPVYYNPSNPQRAELALWAWLRLTPTVLGGIGVVFGIILIGMRWIASRT